MVLIVDTSILVRRTDTSSASHSVAVNAVLRLLKRGEELRALPQCITEFWAVATRPLAANGLGLTPAQTELERVKLEALFPLLPDTPGLYAQWVQIVNRFGVSGKPTHDARIVAAMREHSVAHILTFNAAHFTRYASADIVVIDPALMPQQESNL